MRQSLIGVAHHNPRCVPKISSYGTRLFGRRGLTKIFSQVSGNVATPDAKFNVIGDSPYNLLSVSLSASQNLYTLQGTLVGFGGNAGNAHSTLSLLAPLRRAILGIPFLYQRISSTKPVQVLISTNSSVSVVHMDGSTDWKIFGRGLLAWTGQTVSIKPTLFPSANLAQRGNSELTGRGLFAVSGQGSVYQLVLNTEEKYILHPSNVLAYTVNSKPPVPYRLQSSTFRFQIPDSKTPSFFSNIKFFRVMKQTATWKTISELLLSLRTWTRKVIWADRMFLEFQGPTKILLQSRTWRSTDLFSNQEIEELAKTPSGATYDTGKLQSSKKGEEQALLKEKKIPRESMASVENDGKVKIEPMEVAYP